MLVSPKKLRTDFVIRADWFAFGWQSKIEQAMNHGGLCHDFGFPATVVHPRYASDAGNGNDPTRATALFAILSIEEVRDEGSTYISYPVIQVLTKRLSADGKIDPNGELVFFEYGELEDDPPQVDLVGQLNLDRTRVSYVIP